MQRWGQARESIRTTHAGHVVFKATLRSGASLPLFFSHLRSKGAAGRTKETNELSLFNFIDYAPLFFEREHGIISSEPMGIAEKEIDNEEEEASERASEREREGCGEREKKTTYNILV